MPSHPSVDPTSLTRCPGCDRVARHRHCKWCVWLYCDGCKVVFDPSSAAKLGGVVVERNGEGGTPVKRWLMRWFICTWAGLSVEKIVEVDDARGDGDGDGDVPRTTSRADGRIEENIKRDFQWRDGKIVDHLYDGHNESPCAVCGESKAVHEYAPRTGA